MKNHAGEKTIREIMKTNFFKWQQTIIKMPVIITVCKCVVAIVNSALSIS